MDIKKIIFVDPEPTRSDVVKAMATVIFKNGLTLDRLPILKYKGNSDYTIAYPNTHYQPDSWVDAYYFSDIKDHKRFTKQVISRYKKFLERSQRDTEKEKTTDDTEDNIDRVFKSITSDAKTSY